MNNFKTVVSFTLFNKLRSKPFIISTLVFMLIISIVVHIPYIISLFDKDDKAGKLIGYIQSEQSTEAAQTAEQLKAYYDAVEGSDIKLQGFASTGNAADDEEQLKNAISNGDIQSYIILDAVTGSGLPKITVKSEKLLDFSVASSIEQALYVIRQQTILSQAGLTDEQWQQLQAPIEIDAVQIGTSTDAGEGKSATEQGVNMGIIYFIIIFLFMAVMISGQMIASEVTAEKSSRVMEVLITSVSPLVSMFGKITGMFLLVLSQLVAYIGIGVVNLLLPHNQEIFAGFNFDLSLIDPTIIIISILYFLTGFFLFSTLYAALGSIVSRTEDLGSAIMPMTFISLAGFYIAIFSISTPDSMLVKICSYIPLFSPFVMILRVGLTDIAMWEVAVSLGILVVTIYLAVAFAAKIYRTGVLMYGKRPSWKELIKAMKAFKI